MGSRGTGGSGSAARSTAADLSSMSRREQREFIDQLRTEMGQTGYEAGDPDASPRDKLYVNTGKSFCINTYLLTDGKTYDAPSLTDWGSLINERWVQNAIRQMDSGMKPLTRDIRTARFMSAEAASKMLGVDLNSRTIEALESNAGARSAFRDVLKNVDYTHKAYTSTTYTGTHGSYEENPVKLNIVARKGTNAIITANHREHEIILGRDSHYNFSRNGFHVETLPSGKKQLVIDVVI